MHIAPHLQSARIMDARAVPWTFPACENGFGSPFADASCLDGLHMGPEH